MGWVCVWEHREGPWESTEWGSGEHREGPGGSTERDPGGAQRGALGEHKEELWAEYLLPGAREGEENHGHRLSSVFLHWPGVVLDVCVREREGEGM